VRKRVPIPDAVPEPRVVIIGAGISGLACAYYLRSRHIPFLILEKSHRVGGLIDSEQDGGFLFEFGPQSFRLTSPLKKIIDAAGLGDAVLKSDPRAPRFILHGGKLVLAPMSPVSLLFTSLLDTRAVFRVLEEPLRHTQPPLADESVAAFVRRKFGDQFLQNFVAPFVSGIFAGDPEKLSMRAAFPEVHEWESRHGSVLRGAIKSMKRAKKDDPAARGLCTLKRGNSSLAAGLGRLLEAEINLECGVASIAEAPQDKAPARFDIFFERAGELGCFSALAVIVATEAPCTAALLTEVAPEFAPVLQSISYAPVAVVSLGYRRTALGEPLRGFGFLAPRSEKIHTLGTVFNSSLFPHRAPAEHVLVTSFLGGTSEPQAVAWSDELLVDTAHRVLPRASGNISRRELSRRTRTRRVRRASRARRC
jgi:oxygen-dependent protoporphyrinogen oxidase